MNQRYARHRRNPERARAKRTLWSLAVLALLREGPKHPYEMQREMRLRHTDELLALKRGSLYHAIYQLQRDGLIEPVETSREGRRPERTVFRITDDGEDELVNWLRELIAVPAREPSQFTSALAHISHLSPADALDQLRERSVSLEAGMAAFHAVERRVSAEVGRASVIEVEYARALLEAELRWIDGIIADLKSGKLTWNIDKINIKINNPDSNLNDSKPTETS